MGLTRLLLATFAIAICVMLGAADASAQIYWVQSADYGYGNKRMDVTNTVRRLANGPNFKVNNNTMGVDPAVGKDKTLRIVGRAQNGTTRTFTYKEGQVINSQMFAGGPGGGSPGGGFPGAGFPGNPGAGYGSLRIVQASYGPEGRRGNDVTNQLQSMVRNNRLNIVANNTTMGGDPSPGQSKTLKVLYDYQGQRQTVTVGENGRLNIP